MVFIQSGLGNSMYLVRKQVGTVTTNFQRVLVQESHIKCVCSGNKSLCFRIHTSTRLPPGRVNKEKKMKKKRSRIIK